MPAEKMNLCKPLFVSGGPIGEGREGGREECSLLAKSGWVAAAVMMTMMMMMMMMMMIGVGERA